MRGTIAPIAMSIAADWVESIGLDCRNAARDRGALGELFLIGRNPLSYRRNRPMANDMQIQHDVLAALDGERSVIAGTIGVEVHHGVVKLAGRVNDDAIKTGAERTALGVDGVTAIVMDIDVGGEGPARPTTTV
jgi:osmotically-inducible protein OsmY